MVIRVYFEGDPKLREGFSSFCEELHKLAFATRSKLRFVAGRSTAQADWMVARRQRPHDVNILLVDTEGPAPRQLEENVFYMVQLMEAWFLADKDCLRRYYKNGFNENALHGDPNVEDIPKKDVIDRLERATRNTTKGTYHKTAHGPTILRCLDSAKVRAAAPHCDRFFRSMLTKLAPS